MNRWRKESPSSIPNSLDYVRSTNPVTDRVSLPSYSPSILKVTEIIKLNIKPKSQEHSVQLQIRVNSRNPVGRREGGRETRSSYNLSSNVTLYFLPLSLWSLPSISGLCRRISSRTGWEENLRLPNSATP